MTAAQHSEPFYSTWDFGALTSEAQKEGINKKRKKKKRNELNIICSDPGLVNHHGAKIK